jgi:hypothetical protein
VTKSTGMGRGNGKRLPGTDAEWKAVGREIRKARLALGWTATEMLADALPVGSPKVAQLRNYENGYRPQYATVLGALESTLQLKRGHLGSIVGIGVEQLYPTPFVAPTTEAQRRNDLARIAALERQVSALTEGMAAQAEALATLAQSVQGLLAPVRAPRATKAKAGRATPARGQA